VRGAPASTQQAGGVADRRRGLVGCLRARGGRHSTEDRLSRRREMEMFIVYV